MGARLVQVASLDGELRHTAYAYNVAGLDRTRLYFHSVGQRLSVDHSSTLALDTG